MIGPHGLFRCVLIGWFLVLSAVTPARSQNALSSIGDAATPVPSPIWDLTANLTPEQLAVNEVVYQKLDPDPCDEETSFDRLAWRLAQDGTPASLDALERLEHGGRREQQAAAARAYVYLAQQALLDDDPAGAADFAIHVYLSSAPHRVRMEALRVYCVAANPAESARWIDLIASGGQDARFRPMLDELRGARAER